MARQEGDLCASMFDFTKHLRMASTITSWVLGTTVYFGTHRFVITTDGSTEWVQPAALLLSCPVANTTDAANPQSAELGGSPFVFPFGLLNAAQSFEHLTLDVLAPPDDEFVGMLDYDYESLHDVLNEDVGDSSSNSGSYHPSQECFMSDTPEGQTQLASEEGDPSRTLNTRTAGGSLPQQLRQNPTLEQIALDSKKLPRQNGSSSRSSKRSSASSRAASAVDGPVPWRGTSTDE